MCELLHIRGIYIFKKHSRPCPDFHSLENIK
jgi:hypothetical protein